MKGVVKSISEVLKSHRLPLLKVLLFLQIAFFAYLFFQVVRDDHYFLAHEDEVINFCSAKVFSETGSVRAEGCIAENVSRIGEMNWYGPGYAVIYGTVRNVFGDGLSLFIKIHFVLTMISIALIFFLPVPVEDRLLSAAVLMFMEQFTGYVFTYFPEAIHLLAAVIFVLLLIAIYRSKESHARSRYISIFVLLTFAVALSRVTAIFWLTGLIGLSDSRKMAIRMVIVFIIGMAVTLLFMRYFTAPPYAYDMQKIDAIYSLDIVKFLFTTVKATARNTFTLLISGSPGVYALLLLMTVVLIRWWQTKERLLLAALLVSVSLVAALMAYYSASPWYFLKQSAILVPLLVICLTITSKNSLKYGILFIGVLMLPFQYNNISTTIADHKRGFDHLGTYALFHSSLQEIQANIPDALPVTVLWSYSEFPYGTSAEALLPFSTRAGSPILYTTNIVSDINDAESKFKRHGKLKIDYILSKDSLTLPGTELIYSNSFYSFYRVIE